MRRNGAPSHALKLRAESERSVQVHRRQTKPIVLPETQAIKQHRHLLLRIESEASSDDRTLHVSLVSSPLLAGSRLGTRLAT